VWINSTESDDSLSTGGRTPLFSGLILKVRTNVASMKAPENRRGMKRANADSVDVGDWVYRTARTGDRTAPAGDYMMIVSSISRGAHESIEIYLLRGNVYALKGEGAGPQPKFLGEIQLHPIGAGEWNLPLDGTLVKGCPLEESGDPAEWDST
jgi:hypothetical protein